MNAHGKTFRRPIRRRGFALVELMVAMVLALFLLGAVSQVYVSGKQTFNTGNNLSRIQENSRFALQFMTQDLRQAGFSGCSRIINSVLDTGSAGFNPNFYDPTEVAGGWEFNGTAPGQTYSLTSLDPGDASPTDWAGMGGGAALPTDLTTRNLVPGSDVLIIKRLDKLISVRPTAAVAQAAPTFIVNDARELIGGVPTPAIEQFDLLVISNCQQGDLFQNTWPTTDTDQNIQRENSVAGAIPGNTVPAATPFSQSYDTATDIYSFSSQAYFVGQSQTSGRPALFRLSFSSGQPGPGVEQELIEGVENMQVLYGEDLDGDSVANRFVSADNVLTPANIVTVRIGLVMRALTHSGEDSTPGTATYKVTDNIDISPTIDTLHQRYVATTTVQVRNRSL